VFFILANLVPTWYVSAWVSVCMPGGCSIEFRAWRGEFDGWLFSKCTRWLLRSI
jgi:hypothetical protein